MTDEYIRKVDAADWLKQYGQDVLHGKYKFSLMYIWKNIMDLPSADVVPVVHGKWNKLSYDGFNCNKCGSTFVIMQGRENMHFCPNCGIKMDGKGEE